MTREEAIQVLQTALTSPFIYGEYADAINMAIEALSADAVHIETYRELYEKYVNLKHASAETAQGCDGCRYNTPIPQQLCLRCSRYWRNSYERKGGDTE